MKCSNCQNRIPVGATFCTHCGYKLSSANQTLESDLCESKTIKRALNPYKKIIIIGFIALFTIVHFCCLKCNSLMCPLPQNFQREYCQLHICKRDKCENKKATGKNYCYTHSPTTSVGFDYTPEKGEDVLKFSNIELSHNSVSTYCTGMVTNNGNRTYTFVEVKGVFKNYSGNVLDTDWTYAVGSEGLAPGESTTFRISVDRNSNISKCSVEILEYDKD